MLFPPKKLKRLYKINENSDKFHLKFNAKDYKLAKKKMTCNIFFDFETTYDGESDYFQEKQVKSFRTFSKDQITCAVSFLFDINYSIKNYVQCLKNEKKLRAKF